MTKIKLIYGSDEAEINDFMKDKNVVDVKIGENFNSLMFVIIYKED